MKNFFRLYLLNFSRVFIVLLALTGLLLLFSGCSGKVYVPVEHTVERTDTLRELRVLRDSIHTADSVSVYIKGDTVRIERLRTLVRNRFRTDTLLRIVELRDSVPYPVEVPVEVERPLTPWQQARLDLFPWLAAALLVLLYTLFKPLRK